MQIPARGRVGAAGEECGQVTSAQIMLIIRPMRAFVVDSRSGSPVASTVARTAATNSRAQGGRVGSHRPKRRHNQRLAAMGEQLATAGTVPGGTGEGGGEPTVGEANVRGQRCYTPGRRQAMKAPELLDRIEIDPEVMLGKPVIRGTRITVEILLEKLAAGASTEEVLADYPVLERADVLAALSYARQAVGMDELILETARTA